MKNIHNLLYFLDLVYNYISLVNILIIICSSNECTHTHIRICLSGHVSSLNFYSSSIVEKRSANRHVALEHYKLPFRSVLFNIVSCEGTWRTRRNWSPSAASTSTPAQPPRRFAKVQVETDVGRTGPDEWCSSTPGRTARPLSMGTRDRAYSWSAAGSWPRVRARGRPKRASLYLLARTSAHSHGRPLYHFRYRAARLTVHRSRRLLNPTLFARCITYFVIAHFVPR